MTKFKQTEEKYKHIYLGFGTGTIYSFGCYLVSLANGLNEKGYNFTPEGFNDLLKQNQAWTGEFFNYIDVDRLHEILPNIFTSFEKVEPWNDTLSLENILKPDTVVVCKVDARPIGGTGTHFVLLTGSNGKIAVIHDPWTGKEEKITTRWGNYGNILSLRIFKIKPFVPPQEQSSDANNALQYLVSEFKNLPDTDELKKGNLEGYTRSITKEHQRFSELNEKAKILDGFISKWQATLGVQTEETYSQVLHKIEEEIASLMDKEDLLNNYRDAVHEYLVTVVPRDTLELILGDDKQVLEQLKGVKTIVQKLNQSLQTCRTDLESSGDKNVIHQFNIKKYIIKIIRR